MGAHANGVSGNEIPNSGVTGEQLSNNPHIATRTDNVSDSANSRKSLSNMTRSFGRRIIDHHVMQRTVLLFVGIALMALGVSLSIKADLGTSPISSIPYAVSQISGVTVGVATIIVNALMILLQIVLLRRDTRWVQFAQIVLAVAMGVFIDMWDSVLWFDTPSSYVGQWVMCVFGIVFVGMGVAIEVRANLIMIPGEGAVQALSKVFHVKFSNMKIMFDSSCVILALVATLLCLGSPAGVREGTVAAMLCVGLVVKVTTKTIHAIDLRRWHLAS